MTKRYTTAHRVTSFVLTLVFILCMIPIPQFAEGVPTCRIPIHTHQVSCYSGAELTCTEQEVDEHHHTDECYYPAELTCELLENEEHTHGENCYAPRELECQLDETDGHNHTLACYDLSDATLTCDLEEHPYHTDSCFEDPQEQVDAVDFSNAVVHIYNVDAAMALVYSNQPEDTVSTTPIERDAEIMVRVSDIKVSNTIDLKSDYIFELPSFISIEQTDDYFPLETSTGEEFAYAKFSNDTGKNLIHIYFTDASNKHDITVSVQYNGSINAGKLSHTWRNTTITDTFFDTFEASILVAGANVETTFVYEKQFNRLSSHEIEWTEHIYYTDEDASGFDGTIFTILGESQAIWKDSPIGYMLKDVKIHHGENTVDIGTFTPSSHEYNSDGASVTMEYADNEQDLRTFNLLVSDDSFTGISFTYTSEYHPGVLGDICDIFDFYESSTNTIGTGYAGNIDDKYTGVIKTDDTNFTKQLSVSSDDAGDGSDYMNGPFLQTANGRCENDLVTYTEAVLEINQPCMVGGDYQAYASEQDKSKMTKLLGALANTGRYVPGVKIRIRFDGDADKYSAVDFTDKVTGSASNIQVEEHEIAEPIAITQQMLGECGGSITARLEVAFSNVKFKDYAMMPAGCYTKLVTYDLPSGLYAANGYTTLEYPQSITKSDMPTNIRNIVHSDYDITQIKIDSSLVKDFDFESCLQIDGATPVSVISSIDFSEILENNTTYSVRFREAIKSVLSSEKKTLDSLFVNKILSFENTNNAFYNNTVYALPVSNSNGVITLYIIGRFNRANLSYKTTEHKEKGVLQTTSWSPLLTSVSGTVGKTDILEQVADDSQDLFTYFTTPVTNDFGEDGVLISIKPSVKQDKLGIKIPGESDYDSIPGDVAIYELSWLPINVSSDGKSIEYLEYPFVSSPQSVSDRYSGSRYGSSSARTYKSIYSTDGSNYSGTKSWNLDSSHWDTDMMREGVRYTDSDSSSYDYSAVKLYGYEGGWHHFLVPINLMSMRLPIEVYGDSTDGKGIKLGEFNWDGNRPANFKVNDGKPSDTYDYDPLNDYFVFTLTKEVKCEYSDGIILGDVDLVTEGSKFYISKIELKDGTVIGADEVNNYSDSPYITYANNVPYRVFDADSKVVSNKPANGGDKVLFEFSQAAVNTTDPHWSALMTQIYKAEIDLKLGVNLGVLGDLLYWDFDSDIPDIKSMHVMLCDKEYIIESQDIQSRHVYFDTHEISPLETGVDFLCGPLYNGTANSADILLSIADIKEFEGGEYKSLPIDRVNALSKYFSIQYSPKFSKDGLVQNSHEVYNSSNKYAAEVKSIIDGMSDVEDNPRYKSKMTVTVGQQPSASDTTKYRAILNKFGESDSNLDSVIETIYVDGPTSDQHIVYGSYGRSGKKIVLDSSIVDDPAYHGGQLLVGFRLDAFFDKNYLDRATTAGAYKSATFLNDSSITKEYLPNNNSSPESTGNYTYNYRVTYNSGTTISPQVEIEDEFIFAVGDTTPDILRSWSDIILKHASIQLSTLKVSNAETKSAIESASGTIASRTFKVLDNWELATSGSMAKLTSTPAITIVSKEDAEIQFGDDTFPYAKLSLFKTSTDSIPKNRILDIDYYLIIDWASVISEATAAGLEPIDSLITMNTLKGQNIKEAGNWAYPARVLSGELSKTSRLGDNSIDWEVTYYTNALTNKDLHISDSLTLPSSGTVPTERELNLLRIMDLTHIGIYDKLNNTLLFETPIDPTSSTPILIPDVQFLYTGGTLTPVNHLDLATHSKKLFEITFDSMHRNKGIKIVYTTKLTSDPIVADAQTSSTQLKNSIEFATNGIANSAASSIRFVPKFTPTVHKDTFEVGTHEDMGFRIMANTGLHAASKFVLEDTFAANLPSNHYNLIKPYLTIKDWVVYYNGTPIYAPDAPDPIDLLSDYDLSFEYIPETHGFKLQYTGNSYMPSNTDISVDLVAHLDTATYLASATSQTSFTRFPNLYNKISLDVNGTVVTDTASDNYDIPDDPFTKKGTYNQQTGLITWTSDLYLNNFFTIEQLDPASTQKNKVIITDNLPAGLRYTEGSLSLHDLGGETPGDKLLNGIDYLLETAGRQMKIVLLTPSAHPSVRLTFSTYATVSLDSVYNTLELALQPEQGQGDPTIRTTESEHIHKVLVSKHAGYLTYETAPDIIIRGAKYLDGTLYTTPNTYSFKIVETDGTYTPLPNGYVETVKNDATGHFASTPLNRYIGTYYFTVTEIPGTDPHINYDATEFHIEAQVVKDASGAITVVYSIASPINYDSIEFNNTTKEIPKTSITVTKDWKNDTGTLENPITPEHREGVTVNLMRTLDNTTIHYNNLSVTLSDANNWTHTWEDLPDIGEYSIAEQMSDTLKRYYTSSTSGNPTAGFVITNTLKSPISVSVFKDWADTAPVPHTQHRLPVTVKLLHTINTTTEELSSIVLSDDNGWSYEWVGLEDYGTYSVQEVMTDALKQYYTSTTQLTDDGWVITNTLKDHDDPPAPPIIPDTVTFTVEKIWEGDTAPTGGAGTTGTTGTGSGTYHNHRDNITVQLIKTTPQGPRGGEIIKTAVLSQHNGWKHTWEGLDPDAVYSVKEIMPDTVSPYYTSRIQRTTEPNHIQIINTMEPHIHPVTKQLTVTKEWRGDNADTSSREPISVILIHTLNGNSTELHDKTATLSDLNDWTYTWGDLAYDGIYTIREVMSDTLRGLYTGSVRFNDATDTFIITNTLKTETSPSIIIPPVPPTPTPPVIDNPPVIDEPPVDPHVDTPVDPEIITPPPTTTDDSTEPSYNIDTDKTPMEYLDKQDEKLPDTGKDTTKRGRIRSSKQIVASFIIGIFGTGIMTHRSKRKASGTSDGADASDDNV